MSSSSRPLRNSREVVATATAQAVIAQTPECDLPCRDATAWATVPACLTPIPTLTYAPAMVDEEARYIEMLATATAAALIYDTDAAPVGHAGPYAETRLTSGSGSLRR